MAVEKGYCLICHNTVNQCSSKSLKIFNCSDITSTENSCTEIASGTRIQSQLEVIFILRKLLHIPLPTLAEYLKFSGGENPDCWIALCDECEVWVVSARRKYEEIISATKKFNAIQERIVNKLKDSSTEKSASLKTPIEAEDVEENKNRIVKIRAFVTECSREFVRKHDYKFLQDPSIDGDILANQKLSNPPILLFSSPHQSPSHVDMEDEDDYRSITSSEPDIKLEAEHENKESVKKPKSHSKHRRLIDVEGAFLTEGGRVMFKCQVDSCGKVFRQKQNYQHHKLKHSGERPLLSCDLCEAQFASQRGLHQHVRRVHKNMPPPKKASEAVKMERKARYQRTCPHCGYLTDKYTLPKHIRRVHEHLHPLSCELCGHGVSSKKDLSSHQAELHGICSVDGCKQTFENREQLHQHQVDIHGKEIDTFSCHDCGKLFVMRSSLLRHKQIHEYESKLKEEGESAKEFVCDLCGKGFGVRNGLYTHKRQVHERKRKKFKKGD